MIGKSRPYPGLVLTKEEYHANATHPPDTVHIVCYWANSGCTRRRLESKSYAPRQVAEMMKFAQQIRRTND
jgi:hypothetical protein